MSRTIQYFETVRGVEVEIFAEDFDCDPSVGLPIGPENVYAKTMNGEYFDLTDEEVEKFGIKATEIYLADD